MRRTLPLLVTVALASCVTAAPTPTTDSGKPSTEWLARPSEAARVARVEASLAPVTLPGEAPVRFSLARWMELYKIPGLSVAVFDKSAIVWAKTYGVKEAGGSEPVTLDTLFQAASISKPVTALAVLHYAEQGFWSLDEDINEKLSSWKVPDNELTKVQKVTLRRLLSHSAGLTVHGFPGYAVNEPLPTVQQILDGEKPANTKPVRVDIVPGTQTRYSGGGTTVVQLMMVDQLKKPFPQIMREAVLAPLGLENSTYEQPPPPALAALTAAGTRASGESIEGRWHIYPEMAPAGLWTTPSDLARIAIEVSKAKAGTSTRLLSQPMARQMLTPQSTGFGLGFHLEDDHDGFGHGGSNEGFQSFLIAFASSGSGVAMMANSDNGFLLFERLFPSIAAEYGWKSSPQRLESPMIVADLVLRLRGAEATVAWYKARRRDGPAEGMSPNVLNSIGYRLLLEGKLDDALKVLEANVELYPEDANAYDSLGEGYLKAGRNEESILNYRKSLKLDPTNTNAVKMLEKLGVSP